MLTACARRRLHDAANGREGSARTWAKRLKALDLPWCKLVVPSGFPSGSGGARCWFEPGSDAGLHATVEYLHALVGAELAAGVPPWRIVVGGAGAVAGQCQSLARLCLLAGRRLARRRFAGGGGRLLEPAYLDLEPRSDK